MSAKTKARSTARAKKATAKKPARGVVAKAAGRVVKKAAEAVKKAVRTVKKAVKRRAASIVKPEAAQSRRSGSAALAQRAREPMGAVARSRQRITVEVESVPPPRPDDGEAFIPDPGDGPVSVADDLAEELAEEYLALATSNDSPSEDLLHAAVPEDEGGPFVPSTGKIEFGMDADESNPPDAEVEPLPAPMRGEPN